MTRNTGVIGDGIDLPARVPPPVILLHRSRPGLGTTTQLTQLIYSNSLLFCYFANVSCISNWKTPLSSQKPNTTLALIENGKLQVLKLQTLTC